MCMMRSDKVNWYDHDGYTEMTAPYSNVIVTNKSKSKRSKRKVIAELFCKRELIMFYEERRVRMRE